MEFNTFRILQSCALLILLTMPMKSWSLGLGDIAVESLLDYPLQAKIELLAVRAEDLATLSTKLASTRDFDWVGINRLKILNKLEFSEPVKNGNSFYVSVTSKDPINEPVLNFLVEAQWATGRLLREYTIKLQTADISTVHQNRENSELPLAQTSEIEPTSVNDDTPPPISPRKASVDNEDINHKGEAARQPRYLSVAGDTLSVVAKKLLPESLNDNPMNRLRMMVALLETNPHAFIDHNINGLRSNTELLIPSATEVEQLDQERIVAEVKRQNDQWRNRSSAHIANDVAIQDEPINDYQNRADPPQSPQSESLQESPTATESETIKVSENTSEVDEKPTSAGNQTAQDTAGDQPPLDRAQLSIVSGQEQLAETGALTVASTEYIANLERSVTLAQELAESRRREAEEIKNRVGRLESVIERQERLIKLQNDQLSELNDQLRQLNQPKEAPPAKNYWPWIASALIILVTLLLLYNLFRYVIRKKASAVRSL